MRLGGVFLVVAIIGFQVRLLRQMLRASGFHGAAKKGGRIGGFVLVATLLRENWLAREEYGVGDLNCVAQTQ